MGRLIKFVLGGLIFAFVAGFGADYAGDRCGPGTPCDAWILENLGPLGRWLLVEVLPVAEATLTWLGTRENLYVTALGVVLLLAASVMTSAVMGTLGLLVAAGPGVIFGKIIIEGRPPFITDHYPWVYLIALGGIAVIVLLGVAQRLYEEWSAERMWRDSEPS